MHLSVRLPIIILLPERNSEKNVWISFQEMSQLWCILIFGVHRGTFHCFILVMEYDQQAVRLGEEGGACAGQAVPEGELGNVIILLWDCHTS